MESPERGRTATPCALRIAADADVAQVSDAIVVAWQKIIVALNPIIGERGVAALYRRSLHLTGMVYPWLCGKQEAVQTAIDLAALKSVLTQQSSADAAAGGGALLHTFHELLSTLIGAALTEQLLHFVWDDFLGGPPAQDASR